MTRKTRVSSKYGQSEYCGGLSTIRQKGCCLIVLLVGILLACGQRVLNQRIEHFLTLSAEIKDEELTELISNINRIEINMNVTDYEVEMYHKEGYILLRNVLNAPGVEAMRFITDFVNKHPSNFYKRYNTPNSRYCGFFLHPYYLIPEFRLALQKILERGMSTIASKLLLSNEPPIEVGSILHSTPSGCFSKKDPMKLRGNTHSDQNQGMWSIERKRTIGDNLLVTWTALDRLDKESISMELWPKSHRWQENRWSSLFNESNYCMIYTEMMKSTLNGVIHPTLPAISLTLNPGDVLFFQGFTFHRVMKSAKCGMRTCRRVTTRYVRGEDTSWRPDVLESMTWPYSSWIPKTDGLLVKDTKDLFDLSYTKFKDDLSKPPMIPRIASWLKFWFDCKLHGGVRPEQFVNLCNEDGIISELNSIQA